MQLKGVGGVVSALIVALISTLSLTLIAAYVVSATKTTVRAAVHAAAAAVPPRMELVPLSDECINNVLPVRLTIKPIAMGHKASEVIAYSVASRRPIARAPVVNNTALLELPCNEPVVILVRGESLWLYSYEIDPTKAGLCLSGRIVRATELLEPQLCLNLTSIYSNMTNCSWYLDPVVYNITSDPEAYRGYIPGGKLNTLLAAAYYDAYNSGTIDGDEYNICASGLIYNNPTGWATPKPLTMLERLGVNTTPLTNACNRYWWFKYYLVDDIVYIPGLGAVVTIYYTLKSKLLAWLVFPNGTWIELGQAEKYSILKVNTTIDDVTLSIHYAYNNMEDRSLPYRLLVLRARLLNGIVLYYERNDRVFVQFNITAPPDKILVVMGYTQNPYLTDAGIANIRTDPPLPVVATSIALIGDDNTYFVDYSIGVVLQGYIYKPCSS
ncbi:hypothetical protein [Hyperthermus butylicus]|uniref:Uncharacterized protein n=1 Tax=Hyperthermus butylicus (strain DSM 5456 / JCM 9403 / PLM1-5) TaxID=415426 RepID=A2BLH5_HYPBU|nr:hypothetical protein [Hyperthermus butylicus]ABM80836.1 hypothetical protein Hbut_0989 [Hyperthermus butylicus DSM 5456]